MGCTNCGSSNKVPNGCKSNGSCGTGGCGKLPVFDWLANIDLPNGQSTYDIVEIRFKNSRKSFFGFICGNLPSIISSCFLNLHINFVHYSLY